MIKKIVCGILSLGLFLGCQTAEQMIIGASVGSEDFKKIESIELLILDYLSAGDKALLERAREEVRVMRESPTFNKEYEARLYGLAGEIGFYLGDRGAAFEAVTKVEELTTREPQLYILKSLLADKPEDKILRLEEGLTEVPEVGRLKFFLAELYLEAGEYGKATGLYDEAFKLLNIHYTELYEKNRDMAFHFIENPPEEAAALDYLEAEIVSVSDVLNILLIQTIFLEPVAPGTEPDMEKLLESLKEEQKYLYPGYLRLKDPLVRKDIAYLLLAIISRVENDPVLMTAYSRQFKEAGMDSPVPDVKVDEYYFDAVLVLVERELMELPDGILFYPNKTVSGLELNALLKRIKAYYGGRWDR